MITKTITVEIPAGLEVRPVAVLVQVANQYSSSIYVESGNKKVNAKSIINARALIKVDSYKLKRKPCEHRCPHGFLIHNQQYLSGV